MNVIDSLIDQNQKFFNFYFTKIILLASSWPNQCHNEKNLYSNFRRRNLSAEGKVRLFLE